MHGCAEQEPCAGDRAGRCPTLDGYVADVLEVIGELALGPVTFVGHSVSAMMGVLAAAREPEAFAGLVLLAPSPCFIDDPATGYRGGFSATDIDELLESLDANYLGWSGAMAPVIMGNPGRPELGEELTNSFCRTDPEIARVFARVTFLSDNRADLAAVRTRHRRTTLTGHRWMRRPASPNCWKTAPRTSTSTPRAATSPPCWTAGSPRPTRHCSTGSATSATTWWAAWPSPIS